jgi:SAM-dependent methyltransferase
MTELNDKTDYFANHARARQFPWTLYHRPLERDLAIFLERVAVDVRGMAPDGSAAEGQRGEINVRGGEVLVVGCGLLHEIDEAPVGLSFHVVDVDARAVSAVLSRGDHRITGGTVVAPEQPIDLGRRFAAIYAKEVVEHVDSWPCWLVGLRRALIPGGRLWLSTPNYGEPWLPAIESTVLELVARRAGFSRKAIHPTRFSRSSLARGLAGAGFVDVEVAPTPTRLALTAWARAPQ